MATYSRTEITTTRVEYRVPTGPWGACWVEVEKAVTAVHAELLEAGEVGPPSDDRIRIHARDDEIVVSYEKRSAERT